MKLLIVDDSSIIRKVIQLYVAKYQLEIVGEAGDGKMALEIFKEKEPDIVTMDITMPEIDGLTCVEEMLKMRSGTKILVITALSDEATALKALKLGAKGFLGKPFNTDTFNEAFETLVAG